MEDGWIKIEGWETYPKFSEPVIVWDGKVVKVSSLSHVNNRGLHWSWLRIQDDLTITHWHPMIGGPEC